MRAVAVSVLLVLAVGVSGCATAVRGTSQTIHVGSTPEGAECAFTREGATLGTTTTPGAITVKRDRKPINVVCTKPGHEEARAVLNSLTGSSAYSPLLGVPVVGAVAAVGSLTDMASGANNRYQTALMVKLEPMSAADLAAAATRPQHAPFATATPSAPAAPSPGSAPAGQPPATTPQVLSGPWRARNVLIADRSAGTCSRDGGEYALEVSGDTFTVENINGRMLVAPLPADGAVDQRFRSPSGSRLVIQGNARTRELEIANAAGACRWKLTPLS
jgi:hypothetical protein